MTDKDTRKATVLRPSAIQSHDRGGGASTIPLVGPSVGAKAFINGITSFAPSTKIPYHSHNCEESVMLLEGDAMLDIEGEESVTAAAAGHDLAAGQPVASLSQSLRHRADEDLLDLCAARCHAHAHRDRRHQLRFCRTCRRLRSLGCPPPSMQTN